MERARKILQKYTVYAFVDLSSMVLKLPQGVLTHFFWCVATLSDEAQTLFALELAFQCTFGS